MWEHGNPKYIAEEIIRIVNQNQYRVNHCIIDPLSRSGEPNDNDVFSVLSQTLGSHGISLDVASKDKENGIALLNTMLWSENEMPQLFFFKDCVKTIQQVDDWIFDPETFKPSKENDDMVEALYRLALLDTSWYPETVFDIKNQKNVML